MKTSHLRSGCRSVPVALALGVAAASPAAQAASDLFLRVTGLPGESLDKTHKGDIALLSFSHGVGRNNCPRFVVTKFVDRASPGLAGAASSQSSFSSATLFARTVGQFPVEYYKADMQNVTIASLKVSGSGGDEKVSEEAVLDPASVTITYTPQNIDGSPGTAVTSSYSCQVG